MYPSILRFSSEYDFSLCTPVGTVLSAAYQSIVVLPVDKAVSLFDIQILVATAKPKKFPASVTLTQIARQISATKIDAPLLK